MNVNILLLVLVVGLQAVAGLQYDVSSLNTYDVAQVKEKVLPNDISSVDKNLKLVCSNFAFGIFKLLGFNQADVLRDGFLAKSVDLFEKLKQWAMTGTRMSDGFKWSLVPLFETCSRELAPVVGQSAPSRRHPEPEPEPELERAEPELGGEPRWDFDELESFQYSKALRAADQQDPSKKCTKFNELILSAYDEPLYALKASQKAELHLELSLGLAKHFGAKNSRVAAIVSDLSISCSRVFAEAIRDDGAQSETARRLVRMVLPDWQPQSVAK